jgi:TRAP-type uncharacterized transport system substrate-binding protein
MNLKLKDKITSILSNPALIALMKDKKYKVNANTEISYEGEISSKMTFEKDKIIITFSNLKPKIVYSITGTSFLEVDGLVTTIAALSRVIEANALRVVAAGGNGPAVVPPCPASEPKP